MKIGILTYYRVNNFGANLQAYSTYCYLKHHGHKPIFIHYMSESLYKACNDISDGDVQKVAHIKFVDSHIKEQTEWCSNLLQVQEAIKKHKIEAVIIGSDAVLQHHPLLSRIRKGSRKPFFIEKVGKDRMFPNLFWGTGLNIKKAMLSVSSQNSRFQLFSPWLKHKMRNTLRSVSYISVRDEWTAQMIKSITGTLPAVTPDPVFAFNYNCGHSVPSKHDVVKRHNIPDDYVLVCLRSQIYTKKELQLLKNKFSNIGYACVAFPISTGIKFKHPFDYEIKCPLEPLDWYSLIKNSKAYIGCNMHPIVVSLHNAVPCFSFDDYLNLNFWGTPIVDGSSKIAHIMGVFGLSVSNRIDTTKEHCKATIDEIFQSIVKFPMEQVKQEAINRYKAYENMMLSLLESLK